MIKSFAFSAGDDCRVLILGSMPGVESLRQGQYYAHKRNLFWPFMQELFHIPRELDYENRLQLLRQKGVALWDVAFSCQRPGSLDSNITDVVANDFESLFAVSPNITHVFFNGQKAAALFKKLALPQMTQDCSYATLPSTSPANASIKYDDKLLAWQQVAAVLEAEK